MQYIIDRQLYFSDLKKVLFSQKFCESKDNDFLNAILREVLAEMIMKDAEAEIKRVGSYFALEEILHFIISRWHEIIVNDDVREAMLSSKKYGQYKEEDEDCIRNKGDDNHSRGEYIVNSFFLEKEAIEILYGVMKQVLNVLFRKKVVRIFILQNGIACDLFLENMSEHNLEYVVSEDEGGENDSNRDKMKHLIRGNEEKDIKKMKDRMKNHYKEKSTQEKRGAGLFQQIRGAREGVIENAASSFKIMRMKFFVCDEENLVSFLNQYSTNLGDNEEFLTQYNFDCVISNMSMHFTNALPKIISVYKQMLVSGGILLSTIVGGDSLLSLRRSLIRAQASLYGKALLNIIPMLHHSTLLSLLQQNHFVISNISSDKLQVCYQDLSKLVKEVGIFSNYIYKQKNILENQQICDFLKEERKIMDNIDNIEYEFLTLCAIA